MMQTSSFPRAVSTTLFHGNGKVTIFMEGDGKLSHCQFLTILKTAGQGPQGFPRFGYIMSKICEHLTLSLLMSKHYLGKLTLDC